MVTKKKKGKEKKPVLTIKRFPNEHAAEDYADNMSARLGKKDFGISKPKGKKGVTVLSGIQRPAVLVVTPSRRMPAITPKMRKLK